MQLPNRMWERSVGLLSMVVLLAAVATAQTTKAPKDWTAKDLNQAIATAQTAEDHARIAQYFTLDANRLETQAAEHAQLAETYRKSPSVHAQKHPMSGQTAAHCEFVAQRFREAAQKQRELAKFHEETAASLRR